MNQYLKDFYKEGKPRTLCVLQALPGMSDENILATIALFTSPNEGVEFIHKYHSTTRSLHSLVPDWQLVDTEVYYQSDNLYEAVIVGYYKLIN